MVSETETPFGPILLLVDACEAVARAARLAVKVAARLKAKIYAVTVVETETLSQLLRGKILVQEEMEEFERDLTESSARYLHMVAGIAKEAGVELEEMLLKGGWHQTVLTVQKETGAALLVVCGVSYSMTARDVIGKAKRLIIDDVPCPVLIVK